MERSQQAQEGMLARGVKIYHKWGQLQRQLYAVTKVCIVILSYKSLTYIYIGMTTLALEGSLLEQIFDQQHFVSSMQNQKKIVQCYEQRLENHCHVKGNLHPTMSNVSKIFMQMMHLFMQMLQFFAPIFQFFIQVLQFLCKCHRFLCRCCSLSYSCCKFSVQMMNFFG